MTLNWQPSTTILALRTRARLYQKIRQFFAEREVLEVETPLLSHFGVTDVHIENISAYSGFLQTSPEYAMKRLLAHFQQPIYQISKAFRVDECGRYHNPEFTLLEWYRPGFTHHDLMDEVDALLQFTLNTAPAERFSYRDIFLKHGTLDPFTADINDCIDFLSEKNIALSASAQSMSKDMALQLIMSYCIEPHLGKDQPMFISEYPSSQAALAKISSSNSAVAERFEVYFHGIELANGFHELTDATQQHRRFHQDQHIRQQLNLPPRDIDPRFLAALQHGLPNSAGVALGIDRLLMLLMGATHIDQVISFCWDNA